MRFWFIKAGAAALLLCALSGTADAQSRVDQLSAGAAVSGTDLLANCQGCGASTDLVKTTLAQTLTYMRTNIVGSINGALKANGSGTVSQAACGDLSNAAASCSTDATNAANISSGALAVARLGASAASHATLVDVAGTSTWKVVPDCTDTGGNHLNYTQSSDAFSCGTSGGGSTPTVNAQTGTTYTFVSGDCGNIVTLSNASAITATIPATLAVGCVISAFQIGAGQAALNGTAVSAATLKNFDGYTKIAGQDAGVVLTVISNPGGTAAVVELSGRGA